MKSNGQKSHPVKPRNTKPTTSLPPLPKVTVHTDGACIPNPGRGGYAAILHYHTKSGELKERVITGREDVSTNNRAEILGVIVALEALKFPCQVTVYTDSQYLVGAISRGWLSTWVAKGWRKSKSKPLLNVDLWQRLHPLLSTHQVTARWVKGHNDHPLNSRCDQLANSAASA